MICCTLQKLNSVLKAFASALELVVTAVVRFYHFASFMFEGGVSNSKMQKQSFGIFGLSTIWLSQFKESYYITLPRYLTFDPIWANLKGGFTFVLGELAPSWNPPQPSHSDRSRRHLCRRRHIRSGFLTLSQLDLFLALCLALNCFDGSHLFFHFLLLWIAL